MIGGNRIALEKIVSNVQNKLLCVEILADSIHERSNQSSDIAILILDNLEEIDQFLGDVNALISCEIKGVEIDA